MVTQLRSLKPTETEPMAAAQSMPFLNRIRMDPRKFTTLTNQSLAQRYSSVLGYKDWQNSTQAPFVPQDSQYPQDCRPPQGPRYPQGPQYPQDSTAFGQPQRNARGQQGMREQGLQTCFGCGGSHRFTKHECQGLKDLIQQGLVHLFNQGKLVAGTRNRPRPVLP